MGKIYHEKLMKRKLKIRPNISRQGIKMVFHSDKGVSSLRTHDSPKHLFTS